MIENKASSNEMFFRCALSIDGEPDLIQHFEFKVKYSPSNMNNYVSFVSGFNVKKDELGLADCFEDCIRKHVPKCVGACMNDPTGWSCIVCAGGALICCAANCSC